MHGFDEFLGNLHHQNAEKEPETHFYPKDPAFKKKYGPRGVLHTWADGRVEHDDLGIANDTIVVCGTDNGAEAASWPDGGIAPFHGEKGTTWEGGKTWKIHADGYSFLPSFKGEAS